MSKLVVCITGATGAIYGIRLLEMLAELNVESHLVLSRWAKVTIREETDYTVDYVQKLAAHVYSDADQSAPVSSGSFKHDGVIIAPCSMKTLAGIRAGYADNLIVRSADVALKERRKLILMVRETPLNLIHLENMLAVARAGGLMFPATPAFYHRPENLDDVINHSVGRLLDLVGLDAPRLPRWNGLNNSSDTNH
ncbi:UbiX family flavin prenyltransferase [Pantoea cypripedii]|uniref:UbiX family flavin prenyltransferase n=1 Tax=Pantoea cypripedii TaxID=55209 RepID=UPI002FCA7D09